MCTMCKSNHTKLVSAKKRKKKLVHAHQRINPKVIE